MEQTRELAHEAIDNFILGDEAHLWRHKYIEDASVPYCDIANRTICSPVMPAVIDPDADRIIRGKNEHEAGHAKFTPCDKDPKWSSLKGHLVNCLEDLRIERAVKSLSKAFESDIDWMNSTIVRKNQARFSTGLFNGMHPLNEALAALHFTELGFPPEWELSPEAREYYDKALSTFATWKDADYRSKRGYYEIVKIADRILDIWNEESEQQDNDQQDGQQDGQDNQNSQNGQQGQNGQSGSQSGDQSSNSQNGQDSQGGRQGDQSDSKDGQNGDQSNSQSGDQNGQDSQGNSQSNQDSQKPNGSNGRQNCQDGSEEQDGNQDSQNGQEGQSEDKSDSKDGQEEQDGNQEGNESSGNPDGKQDGSDGQPDNQDNGRNGRTEGQSDNAQDSGNGRKSSQDSHGQTVTVRKLENRRHKNPNGRGNVRSVEDDFVDNDWEEDAIREELQRIFDQSRSFIGDYKPYTAKDETIQSPSDKEAFDRAFSHIRGATSTLQSYLEQSLRTLSRSREITGMERGTLNVHRHAVDIATSRTRNIFSRTTKGISLDTAVTILLDESGSIGPTTSAEFRKMTIAFSEVLERLKMKFEVLGHTTEYNYGAPRGFTRTSKLVMFEHKTFDQRYASEKYRLGTISHHDCNLDGEALLSAFKRNIVQKASRHIILVFSDGLPNDGETPHQILYRNLTDTISLCRRNGVEVYAFGIGTSEPEKFYGKENFVYLPSVRELTGAFFRRTSEIITMGRKN